MSHSLIPSFLFVPSSLFRLRQNDELTLVVSISREKDNEEMKEDGGTDLTRRGEGGGGGRLPSSLHSCITDTVTSLCIPN